MATKNNIRRDYLLISRLLQNDYPSAATLLRHLKNHDAEIDKRTFQRDIADIRENFDIDIVYGRNKNGYRIDTPSSELNKLLYFIGLAESSDIILSSIRDKRDLLKYVAISPYTQAKGVEKIGILLRAIRNTIVIRFNHAKYETDEIKEYTVESYLLKEFDGRWYLFAFVTALDTFRTFGLDRISAITFTDNLFERNKKRIETAEKFENVYGLVYEPEQNKSPRIETVLLRFSPLMVKHLSTLPLHHSQTIDGDTVSLQVIINPELENRLLSYGEHVEVLSPNSLREKIKQRLTKIFNQYGS